MYNNKKISVIIPCYNEERGLKGILENKPPFVDEVIVVDNDSTDNTKDIAKKYGAIIVYEKSRGYGQAYMAGLPKTTGDIVITSDGDNSYPLSNLVTMLSYMERGDYDFVVGCRFPMVHTNAQPAINKIANRCISWLIRVLFKINLTDSQSGMMAFKKSVLDEIKVQNTDMGFSQEMKIKAFLNPKIKCGEVHIFYLKRLGEVKFKKVNAVKNLFAVLSLFIKSAHKQKHTSSEITSEERTKVN